MIDLIEHFRSALIGLKVSHIWRGYGSALFVEFGELTSTNRRDGSSGSPNGTIGMMVEWSWRIEGKNEILCGSWSDESIWQPTFDRLVGREAIGLSTFGRLPEITVSLSGDIHVASFMTAEGDPAWTLFDRTHPTETISIGCRSGTIAADDATSTCP